MKNCKQKSAKNMYSCRWSCLVQQLLCLHSMVGRKSILNNYWWWFSLLSFSFFSKIHKKMHSRVKFCMTDYLMTFWVHGCLHFLVDVCTMYMIVMMLWKIFFENPRINLYLLDDIHNQFEGSLITYTKYVRDWEKFMFSTVED